MGRFHNKTVHYKDQVYQDLKKRFEEEGGLFTDTAFPAMDLVLGTTNLPENIEWKRPGELVSNPKLVIDVESPKTVRGGELSCNWMVSACAILASINEIRNKIIPDYWDQEWGEKKYCGIFYFKFWRFGRWINVLVDDLLPTVNGSLLTTQSGSEGEFWATLVEKAYAKLHGSYEALRENDLSDALVDFTGGVTEIIDLMAGRYFELEDKRCQMFDSLRKEISEHSIVCVSVAAPNVSSFGERTELGLTRGHTYHMTDVKKVHLGETTLRSLFNGREKIALVRLRDSRQEDIKPPGSPDSALSSDDNNPFVYTTDALTRLRSRNSGWQQIKDSERQRLGLIFRDSSEFWMPLEDAVSEFSELIICRLVSENFFAVPGKKWRGSSLKGQWESGPRDSKMDRSGGGDINQESFLRNPQYIFETNMDIEIMIQLLQYQEEEPSPTSNSILQLIGFHIIKVENNRTTRLHKLWDHTPVVVADDHKRKREVMYRGHLPIGRYIILPTLYREGDTAQFLLRIFSRDELINLKELKEDIPRSLVPCSCLLPEVEWVTVLTIISAELSKSQMWGSSTNPYCSVICEGNKVKTPVARDDNQPDWNTSFIFFRKKIGKPLTIKVFTRNSLFPDELIGECELPASVTHSPTPLDAALIKKQKAKDETESISAGTLRLTIFTEDNLQAI